MQVPLSEVPEQEDPFERAYKVEKQKFKTKGSLANLVPSKKGEGDIILSFHWHDYEAVVNNPNTMAFTILDEASGPGKRPTLTSAPKPDDSDDEDENKDGENVSKEPNCLMLRVVSAKGLPAMDTGLMDSGLSDPFVRIRVGEESLTTPVIKRNLDPVWNAEFMIPCYLTAEYTCPEMELVVEDQDFGGAKTDFMGKIGPINMEEFKDRQFYIMTDQKLKNKQGKLDAKSRGTITYCVQWIYLKKFDKGEPVKRSAFAKFFLGVNEDEADDDEEQGDDDDEEAVEELSPEEKKKMEEEEAERKEEQRRALEGIKLESGDYSVQVHIIEVRDLPAKDLSGTSDPVVFVEMFDQKQSTEVKDQCLSAVFDDLFIFNQKDVDKDEMEDMQVRIAVMDADGMSRNDLIGVYVCDLSWVYFRQNHELYRTWVGLVNDEEPEKYTGVQGYCKISIQVVGPKDKLVVHNEKEDKKKEKQLEAQNAGGLSGPVIMPAALRPETMWLCCTVWRSEYMPAVDVLTGGIDACFKIKFGDKKGTQTKTKSIKANARDKLNVDFTTQLWLPITTPTTTKVVKLILGDYDAGVAFSDVATTYFDWGEIQSIHLEDKMAKLKAKEDAEAKAEEEAKAAKKSKGKKPALTAVGEEETKGEALISEADLEAGDEPKEIDYNVRLGSKEAPFWCPMYGAKTSSAGFEGGFKQLANAMGDIGGTDWTKMYNSRPDIGSTYRGRALVANKLYSHNEALAVKMDKSLHKKIEHKEAFRRKISARKLEKPREEKVVLSALVVSGVMLPCSSAEIEITCGRYTVGTGKKSVDKMSSDFCSMISTEDEEMVQPVDRRQIPDVIIYLKQKGVPIAFHRYEAKDLLEKGFTELPEPDWQQLKADKSMGIIPDKTFPGSILIAIGMGTQAQWDKVKQGWTDAPRGDDKLECELRVHLYQCRGLPDADMGGGIDPFMRVRFGGELDKTETVYANNDPMYYKTFRLGGSESKSTIYAPTDNNLLQQVNLQVFDEDLGGFDEDYIGMLFHKFVDSEVQTARLNSSGELEVVNNLGEVITDTMEPPRPVWQVLFEEEINDDGTTDCEGEVLASFQLIRISEDCKGKKLPEPPSIQPDFREAAVEVICIGIRDMAPYNFLPMQQPHMKFTLESVFKKEDKKSGQTKLLPQVFQRETESSKKPIPKDANFLTREIIECELPVDPIFCPPLKIQVFDTRLGGFLVPEVGKCNWPLSNLCPWSDEYVERDMTMLNTDVNAGEKEALDELARKAGLAVGGEGGEELTEEEREERLKKLREQQLSNNIQAIEEAEEARRLEAEAAERRRKAEEEAAREKPIEELNEELWKTQTLDYDAGLGVFNAMHHVDDEDNELVKNAKLLEALEKRKAERRAKIAKAKQMKLEQEEAERGDDDELDEDPIYMRSPNPRYKPDAKDPSPEEEEEFIKRERLDEELEAEKMRGTPFDRHDLSLGSKVAGDFVDADWRIVGYFKGMIRVLESPKDPPLFDLKQVLFPAPVTVRAYVLKALKLAAKDLNLDGSPGKSDPYLVVKLGKEVVNQQDQHFDDCIECDFHQQFEFKAEIPGASMLTVEVFDYDTFGSDDLIGRTRIDLEDRWFDKRWTDLGHEHRNEEPPSEKNNQTPISWDKKPLELRKLFIETARQPQGYIEFWVDILRPEEAATFEAFKVALPPNMPAEVRLIIWKAREVPAMDTAEQMNDMYVKCWCEGSEQQETDTHWRAKKGKASWNYRMKYSVELGHSTKLMKFPYLRIQTWDADVLKWNDIISEKTIDIGRWLQKCQKKQEIITCYKDPPTKKERKEAEALLQAIEDDALPEDEDEDEDEEGGEAEEEQKPLIDATKEESKAKEEVSMADAEMRSMESEMDSVSREHAKDSKRASTLAAAAEYNDELAIANDLIELEDAAAAARSAEDVIASELAEHEPDIAESAAKAKTTLAKMHDAGMTNEQIKKGPDIN